MKFQTLLVLVFSLAATLVNASTAFERLKWGPRFEVADNFQSIGIELQTPKLYGFKNFSGTEMHHTLVLGLHSLRVDNVITDDSGDYESASNLSFNLGLRAFNSSNSMYSELSAVLLQPHDDIGSESSVGGMLRAGYLLDFPSRFGAEDINYFDVGVSYRFGIDEADRLTSNPDFFNGLSLSVGFLY